MLYYHYLTITSVIISYHALVITIDIFYVSFVEIDVLYFNNSLQVHVHFISGGKIGKIGTTDNYDDDG